MHNIIKFLKSRVFFLFMAIFVQILVLLFVLTYFSSQFISFYAFCMGIAFFVCIHVINRQSDSSSKLLWVFLIMAFPFFGGFLYLLFGEKKIPKSLMIKDRQAYKDYQQYAKENLQTLAQATDDTILDKMVSMAWSNGYFPVYSNQDVTYFATGEDQYKHFIQELVKAQHFIFMEFFIINKGLMWNTILQILMDKAKAGVDVRLIYDDAGSISYLDTNYPEWLKSHGVKTHVFNKMKPTLAMQMNNRDHRKILVIDGKVAFTGGCNISDEYINTKRRFGYWKDMGLMIKGRSVDTFTISFLQIWNYEEDIKTSYEPYLSKVTSLYPSSGYILPFSDSPTDDANIGLNMHLNMINAANRYFWITTPYLVLDTEMINAINLAVYNGVDVRIVVPGIPDKKLVYEVTRANYNILIKNGVKIYEYTPGFIHGKVALCDDRNSLVGTVNMDFRSYYLHYECGVWLHDVPCIMDIKKDFEQIFKVSHQVTLEEVKNVSWIVDFIRQILRIFSPML